MVADKHRTDPDNPEWTEEDFTRARPASEVHGAKVAGQLVRKGGRPPKPVEERKQQVTMRFAPDLLQALRDTGPGWQTRVEEVLRREFLGEDEDHPVEGKELRHWQTEDGRVHVTVRPRRRTEDEEFVDWLSSPTEGSALFASMSAIASNAAAKRDVQAGRLSKSGGRKFAARKQSKKKRA